MNYRHMYHAGNFADIFKHFITYMVVEYILKKDKGAFFLDAFAGTGLYDLLSYEASRTMEYDNGVSQFMASKFLNQDTNCFQETLRNDYKLSLYPGSCLQISRLIRPQDRLVANELHPDDYALLRGLLSPSSDISPRNVSLTHLDAYLAIRGFLPPQERRGMILIDPPFEKKNEFELLVSELKYWKKSWPTGCYVIWYPIKDPTSVSYFYRALNSAHFAHMLISEISLNHTRNKEGDTLSAGGLKKCGIVVLNTPYQIYDRLLAATNELQSCLDCEIITKFEAGELTTP